MVLAQKHILRPVEQNREPRYESTLLYPPYFWQRGQKYLMEKRQPLQQMLLGKVVIHLQETKIRSMSYPVLVSTQNGSRTLISDPKLWS
jgi:hypothetical protein